MTKTERYFGAGGEPAPAEGAAWKTEAGEDENGLFVCRTLMRNSRGEWETCRTLKRAPDGKDVTTTYTDDHNNPSPQSTATGIHEETLQGGLIVECRLLSKLPTSKRKEPVTLKEEKTGG